MHVRSKKIAVAAVAAGSLAAGAGALAAVANHGKGSTAVQAANGSFAAAKSGSTGPLADGDHHRGPGLQLTAAVTYLGISEASLRTQLESGKTLAQVAAATDGKSAAGLIDALVTTEQKELAAAVTAGRITQAQADAFSANLKAHVTAEVNGQHGEHGGRGPGFGHGPGGHGGGHLTDAATYLGITEAQLRTQLEAGKTLAQVAQATDGKTVAGLVAALVASEKQELAAAVKAGSLTQAQSDSIASGLEARFTALVNGTFGPRGDHDGDGDHGGAPPAAVNPAPASSGASL